MGVLYDIPHHVYFMGYAATTGVILQWNPYHNFSIHRYHHSWFDEYNSCLPTEDKKNPSYLLLEKYLESLLHNLDPLNLI